MNFLLLHEFFRSKSKGFWLPALKGDQFTISTLSLSVVIIVSNCFIFLQHHNVNGKTIAGNYETHRDKNWRAGRKGSIDNKRSINNLILLTILNNIFWSVLSHLVNFFFLQIVDNLRSFQFQTSEIEIQI